ncbi:flavodoxin domain-containing protein [Treponema phagedenis]|uniref:flavodoxin domain-containing protein n=1 Tax=Treponema phagedenis TaxID=162 RepID=UPI0001F63B76|nr:flavodoxin domain-containing protein [Treponema phagedenis]EFW38561.1 4Fe-4S binding domain protein [Treponema phagedenis F0421]TYT78227.1 ferredoxin [Treponema phagedenis]
MATIKKVKAVFFSATGKTKNIILQCAKNLADNLAVPLETDDFTLPENHTAVRQFSAEDLVVFGTPTYAGRIPNKVLPFVQELFQGNGALTVALVTFGNRRFDNSLTELQSELTKNNFRVIGAGAFVCEHAFADIALTRPDKTDFDLLNNLCTAVLDKLKTQTDFPALAVRGNEKLEGYYKPLGLDGQPTNFLKAKPITDMTKCDRCGVCIKVCPMGSIAADDPANVFGICIKCQACLVYCHTGAKSFDDPAFLSHKVMLEKNYTAPAASEIFV